MKHLFLVVLACFPAGSLLSADAAVLEDFESKTLPANLVQQSAKASLKRSGDNQALEIRCQAEGRPGIALEAPETGWDWSGYAGIAAEVHNLSGEPVDIFASVESLGQDGRRQYGRNHRTFEPGERGTLHIFFTHGGTGIFQGLRAIPIYGVTSAHGTQIPSFTIEQGNVRSFQIYLLRPEGPRKLLIDNIRLFESGAPEERIVPFPFVDRFGQYIHRDWRGKVASEKDFTQQREEEAAALRAAPALPGRDSLGGWAAGPQLEATGWFRSENIDGKWWLVTPGGRLFLSFGMNCVDEGNATSLDGRDGWYEELPRDGRFYLTNLIRKYGEDHRAAWREVSYARLRSWGFNTIGNWSDGEVLKNSPMPFTVNFGVQGAFPRVEGSTGFWSKGAEFMVEGFEEQVDGIVAKAVEPYKDNPLCIGYFVDNEMSWGGLYEGILASPPEQPARKALLEELKTKYASIEALNAAWGCKAVDWDTLRAPNPPSETGRADLDSFVHRYALKYFAAVKAALRKHAPNQLYLGCRFSMEPAPRSLYEACAKEADVVSANLYLRGIMCEEWTGENGLGKPVLIGEFHFGAADRNMLHPGLVPAPDQQARAEGFKEYVRGVVQCPAFVGCHWFQYVDQPLTGRAGDLESFNVGFVQETDYPYPEMVEAARDVFADAYALRKSR